MKDKAFTIIELLVVIAIIFFALAVSMPALQSVRENAKSVMCSSNIKQMLIALVAYENQNYTFPYGTFIKPATPPPGGYSALSSYDTPCWYWYDFLTDFVGKNREKKTVLFCPSRKIVEGPGIINILLGGYGVNEAICKNNVTGNIAEIRGLPLKSSQIPYPAQTMLVMDSGYGIITWYHALDSNIPPPIPLRNKYEDAGYVPGLYEVNKNRILYFRPTVDFRVDALIGRHPDRAVNTGFVDGHVSKQNAYDFYVRKINNEYTNRSPLWLPK